MSGFLSWSVDFLSSMKGNGDNWSDFHQHIKEIVGNLFSEGLLKYMVMWRAGKITHELCSGPRCLVGTPRGPIHSVICKVWLSFLSLSLFLPLSSPLRIHDVPPGSAVWVWLNNYKLQAADLSFTFLNMPTCAFCGDANQYQSFSHYCHWKYSGSMFVLFPGFWQYNVAQQFAVSANNTKELHNKSFLYLLSPPLCHWN